MSCRGVPLWAPPIERNGGFASKVMSHARFGFAAGCEAVAMPRRRQGFYILGYALGATFGPINSKG